MFDTSKYLKSKWLKGSDLQPGRPLTVTISRAYEHTFEQDNEQKPALDFSDFDQSLVLNKTQIATLVNLFGGDPRRWIGQPINLTPVPSGYQGKFTILIAAVPTTNGRPVMARQPAVVLPAGDMPDHREYADEDAPF